jgi:hypothetical protein
VPFISVLCFSRISPGSSPSIDGYLGPPKAASLIRCGSKHPRNAGATSGPRSGAVYQSRASPTKSTARLPIERAMNSAAASHAEIARGAATRNLVRVRKAHNPRMDRPGHSERSTHVIGRHRYDRECPYPLAAGGVEYLGAHVAQCGARPLFFQSLTSVASC